MKVRGVNNVTCQFCGKHFPTPQGRAAHERISHEKEYYGRRKPAEQQKDAAGLTFSMVKPNGPVSGITDLPCPPQLLTLNAVQELTKLMDKFNQEISVVCTKINELRGFEKDLEKLKAERVVVEQALKSLQPAEATVNPNAERVADEAAAREQLLRVIAR